ncbi:MAG: NAD(P)H-dependent oxidoreductase subunit E [Lentisphaeria bacterium]|nr:NAD(P)H-dependent oxidoreductase subunit E [Lentisphaeria bacterium]
MACSACAAPASLLEAFPEKRAALEAYLSSLPIGDDRERNRGLLIQSLHRAQGLFGYLPEEVQRLVADRLRLHLSEVYGVVSFYSFFTDKPVGRYRINVCMGTACFVRGAGKVLDEFKRYLSVGEGETTPDGKFTLGALRCVGACSLAPVVMVNGFVHGNVTPKRVADIIEQCD